VDTLCDELTAEHDDLDRIVDGADLEAPTPAPGGRCATRSATSGSSTSGPDGPHDPDAFRIDAEQLLAGGTDVANDRVEPFPPPTCWPVGATTASGSSPMPAPSTRSCACRGTARRWEPLVHHGAPDGDVGARPGRRRRAGRPPRADGPLAPRGHIGVGARPFSYAANGRQPNDAPIRVELAGPSGDTWTWGPEDAADRVTGPALDFCLLVTQRRHRDDVAVARDRRRRGRVARHRPVLRRPPGEGRRPGQFA
jgi:hypothetical protein